MRKSDPALDPICASFGNCQLDGKSRLLRKRGEVVHLTPKGFELLELLLVRRPAVVTKQEIMNVLWPNTFVAEANVPNLIAEIREALDDLPTAAPLIRTVHRVGYAFSAKVDVVEDATGLEQASDEFAVSVDGRHVRLVRGDNIIGRGKTCQIRVDSPAVSRRHARIRLQDGVALISDLGSKNGTRVAGARLKGVTRLRDGDEIRVGDARLTFRTSERESTTTTCLTSSDPGGKRSGARRRRPATSPGLDRER
jgi:DNA-binding winged helix-turn-helix (wHTH) protein